MSYRPPPPSRGGGEYSSRGHNSGPSSSRDRDPDRDRDRNRDRNLPPRPDYDRRAPLPARRRSRSPEPRRGGHDRDTRGGGHWDDRGSSRGGYVPPPRDRDDGGRRGGYVPPPRDSRSSAGYERERERDAGHGYVPPPRDEGSRRRRDGEDRHDRDEGDRRRNERDEGHRSRREESPTRPPPTSHPEQHAVDVRGEDTQEPVVEQSEEDMMAAMGFGGFGTTKNHKVEGNASGSANVKKERTWRQYMNRKGGFNRPLDPLKK